MFTGIISQVAEVADSQNTGEGLKLTCRRPAGWTDLAIGESIATNGVCLTVTAITGDTYECFLTPETLSKTAFGQHVPLQVNLERSLTMKDHLGGHFVQGHIDGVGTITEIDSSNGCQVTIAFQPKDRPLVVYKGSITINGVALTISSVEDDRFQVALIPHTLQHTTLAAARVGDLVNLEFDMLGKYVVNILKAKES